MPEIQDHHDEPFVIDNFPFGIDVGAKHEALTKRGHGLQWVRDDTRLNSILVLEKGLGGAKDFKTDRLDPVHPVTITLEGGKIVTLILKDGKLLITPNFKLDRNRRRMKQDADGEERIIGVRWHALPGSLLRDHPVKPQPLSSIHVVLFNSVEAVRTVGNRGVRKRRDTGSRRK